MVGPARRREAVAHLRRVFEVGERGACRVMNQPRNTPRYDRKQPMKDRALTAYIHRLARREPRAGYRGVTRLLRREGWQINEKRVHRIWKQEGLKVPSRPARKRARGSSENSMQRHAATRLNQVWTYDFVTTTANRKLFPPMLKTTRLPERKSTERYRFLMS